MTHSELVPGRWECQRRDTRHTHNLVFRGLGLGRLGHGHHHDLAKGGVHVHAPHSTRPTIPGWSIAALILTRLVPAAVPSVGHRQLLVVLAVCYVPCGLLLYVSTSLAHDALVPVDELLHFPDFSGLDGKKSLEVLGPIVIHPSKSAIHKEGEGRKAASPIHRHHGRGTEYVAQMSTRCPKEYDDKPQPMNHQRAERTPE